MFQTADDTQNQNQNFVITICTNLTPDGKTHRNKYSYVLSFCICMGQGWYSSLVGQTGVHHNIICDLCRTDSVEDEFHVLCFPIHVKMSERDCSIVPSDGLEYFSDLEKCAHFLRNNQKLLLNFWLILNILRRSVLINVYRCRIIVTYFTGNCTVTIYHSCWYQLLPIR